MPAGPSSTNSQVSGGGRSRRRQWCSDNDVHDRHRAVRTGHPAVGGPARMRPHVGGPRDGHESASLLRRLRADAVVHPPAQPAGLHRIRRQGGPAGRLLRHRRHDVCRGTRSRRPPVRDVPAEDVEARRGARRGPGDELRHRPRADLRDRHHLGSAQSAPAHQRDGRADVMRQRRSDARQSRECVAASPPRRPASRPGRHRRRRGTPVANFDEMSTAVRKLNGPTELTVQRDENGQTREFVTTVNVTPSQRFVAKDGATDGAEPTPTQVGTIAAAASFDPLSTTRCLRSRRPSPSPAIWPSRSASRWPRSPPRSGRWCSPSAAGNGTRRP